MTGPYGQAAWSILQAGYSPIPLDLATKDGGIPTGYTGYDGRMASGADVQTWIEDRPGDNVGARLPVNVLGLDVDANDGKVGAATLRSLTDKYGPLPRTWRVSSRFDGEYDGASGIRLFRLPDEYAAKAVDRSAGWVTGWESIDVVRFAHRFAVAPPSIHPGRGTAYRVLDESTGELGDELPNVADLPMLPDAWLPALLQGDEGRERRDKAGSQWWTEGRPCPIVAEMVGKSLAEMESGRHDGAGAGIMRLTRLGERGHAGVRRAIDTLHGAFIEAVTEAGPGQRTAKKAEHEWKSWVAGTDARIEADGLTPSWDRGCVHPGPTLAVVADTADDAPAKPAFTLVSFADIEARDTNWIVPGLIPEGDAVIFLGEEGIGKGLWWCHLLGKVTTGPEAIDVLVIVSEDDPERTVKPRLEAAGADVSRVHLMVADPETMTGVPLIPGQSAEVAAMIERTGARLVLIDPWMSVVPGRLQLKDTQQARQALDPVVRLARSSGATIILVTHTNRAVGGSARGKYGATIALRQAGRVCLMALQDPTDESVIYVGIEKANITAKPAAVKYEKSGTGAHWKVTDTGEPTGLTITELMATFDRDGDERTTDKWTDVVLLAGSNGGLVTRAEIVAVYEGSPDPAKTADKAISRWRNLTPPKLVPVAGQRGVFEVSAGPRKAEPPATPRTVHHGTTGGMGGKSKKSGQLPPEPPVVPHADAGGSAGGSDEVDLFDSFRDPWPASA